MRTVCVIATASMLLTAGSIGMATAAFAADRVFNLHQTVSFALNNNGELKALREEKGVRKAEVIKAGLYPNPVLEIDATTGELTGSRFENSLSVGISQEFPTMGKRGKRRQMAEKEAEGFERQVDNSARLLIEEVKTTFYDLLLAEKKTALAERFIVLNNQLLDMAKQRLEAGDIPELELNLARVEVARSEAKKAEAEREIYPAKEQLLALMGFSSGETIHFSGSLDNKPFSKDVAKLKGLALAGRPDLQELQAEREKSDSGINLADAERFPDVTVGFGYQRENSVIDVAGEDIKSRDNLIGLKLSIPLPIFDRNQGGIHEARARKGSTEHRYLHRRMAVEREVEAAFAGLTSSEKALAIYEKSIMPQLEENLMLVREAYRLGEVGILTVIEEQKKFFEVSDGYLATLHNRRIALVKLESAVGTILE